MALQLERERERARAQQETEAHPKAIRAAMQERDELSLYVEVAVREAWLELAARVEELLERLHPPALELPLGL